MWWCDACGQEIAKVQDGYVEFWVDDNEKVHGPPRLVHTKLAGTKCQSDPRKLSQRGLSIKDLDLAEFLGPTGLVRLMAAQADYSFDPREFGEFVCRLHVPGHEAARRFYDEAMSEGIVEPNIPQGLLWPDQIAAILAWAKTRP